MGYSSHASEMAFARRGHLASLLVVLALFIESAIGKPNCEASTFQDVKLSNGKILNIGTQLHTGLSFGAPAEIDHYSVNVTDLDACEVTITYTHPGYNDTINTSVWLPTPEKWTGRFLGAGGSGWSMGLDTNTTLSWAASEGFAIVETDESRQLPQSRWEADQLAGAC